MDGTQSITFLLTAISQVGFPIVLTGYLLLRFEKKIDLLTQTIRDLMEVLASKGDEKHAR